MVDRTEDDLTAFDFTADASAPQPADAVDAFDFSAPESEPAPDPFDTYEPEPEDGGSTAADLLDDDDDAETDEDDVDAYTSTVSNPAETVTVSALMDGSLREITLSADVATMTEEQLTDEILVLAHLARQKGLASQRSYLEDNEVLRNGMRELGLDDDFVTDMVEGGMQLPTQKQVDAEQAEVFATRYAADD
jgi:hypothetical protein